MLSWRWRRHVDLTRWPKAWFFPPPQTQTPPLCACLQLRGPHSEGFDQELQTVSLVLCDGVIYSPDNALLWSSVELCTVDQCVYLYLQPVCARLRLFVLTSILAVCVCVCVCVCEFSQVFPRVVHAGDAGWVAPPAVRVRRGYAEGHQQHGAVPAHHHAPGGARPGLPVSGPARTAPFRNGGGGMGGRAPKCSVCRPERTQRVHKVLAKAAPLFIYERSSASGQSQNMSVWISRTDSSPPESKTHIFPLTCRAVYPSRLLPGFEDVCLLSNIMELDDAFACGEKLNSSVTFLKSSI